MAKTKGTQSQIIQGGITIKSKGNVTIKASKVAGRDNVEKHVVNVSFAPVYHALNESATIPPETKAAVEEAAKQVEQEVKKGAKAKPSFIQERVQNILRMAPDIGEIVVATLLNPAAGVSLAVKKVVSKAQSEIAN